MKNPKFQVPSSKEAPSSKFQDGVDARPLKLGFWNFFGTWNLELGTFFLSLLFSCLAIPSSPAAEQFGDISIAPQPFALGDRRMTVANLTEAQKRIVEWDEGPLVVIAGAGTGKTRVIVERAAHLLADLMARDSHPIRRLRRGPVAQQVLAMRLRGDVSGEGEMTERLGLCFREADRGAVGEGVHPPSRGDRLRRERTRERDRYEHIRGQPVGIRADHTDTGQSQVAADD